MGSLLYFDAGLYGFLLSVVLVVGFCFVLFCFERGSPCIAQAHLELKILLPQSPEH
jgi:hypothetical protein